MSDNIKREIVETIKSDSIVTGTMATLNEADKKIVDDMLDEFVDSFMLPLFESLEEIKNSKELREKIVEEFKKSSNKP